MSDATKGQSARDVNDNHVHEKMDISMHDTKGLCFPVLILY